MMYFLIIFLGGGFKYFLFSPLFGEDSHFDSHFSNGLVQPPTSFLFVDASLASSFGEKNTCHNAPDKRCRDRTSSLKSFYATRNELDLGGVVFS